MILLDSSILIELFRILNTLTESKALKYLNNAIY